MNRVLKQMRRRTAIQIWFGTVAAVVATSLAFGAGVAASTWAMLLAMSLVPPAIVWLLWPGAQSPTVAEVLHRVDRGA